MFAWSLVLTANKQKFRKDTKGCALSVEPKKEETAAELTIDDASSP